MGATNNAERTAPQQPASNVLQIVSGAEAFTMRRKQLKQTINSIQERWATYREGDDPMARQVADNSEQAQAKRFAFMAQRIASVELTLYNTTVWLRVPSAPGNPYGLGPEFSGRTLAQAVDAAIEYINLTRK